MNKKTISVLLGIFISLTFFAHAFAQKEKEVMMRYDYSSPKASFESLKKAIRENDIEGILIHDWQGYKLAEGSAVYGMSFEDTLATTPFKSEITPEERDYLRKRGQSEEAYKQMRYQMFDLIWPDGKITELNFVKESERQHVKEGSLEVTRCVIILERKSDGEQFEAMAFNYDGTNEWWILVQRAGE
jgi:hypothetical protein